MGALARGNCPNCGHEVALRKRDLVREHQLPGGRRTAYGSRLCPGSGRPAVQVTQKAVR